MAVFVLLLFNQSQINSLNIGGGSGFGDIRPGASAKEIAAAILPGEESKLRPFSINGKPIELSLDKNSILISLDPFPPNGGQTGQIPSDLDDEQGKIFSELLYGKAENNYQDAVGGCLFCNAPGGAGGCFKKRVIRGLTYTLVKQGWTKGEITNELRTWMFYYFPGLAVKWAMYYNQQGEDLNNIPIDVQTFSRNGKLRVESALRGQDINAAVPDQVGGCF